MRHRNAERGFALAGAILAMVVIASLIAGAFFAARQELLVGRSSQTYQRAFDAAEAGMDQTIADWSTTALNAMAVGDSAGPFVHTLSGNLGYDTTFVRRLNNELFVVRTVGRDRNNLARRMLAALVRLQQIAISIEAGLTTRSQLKLGGSSFIDGVDALPSGWSCPNYVPDTLPGILTRDSTQIQTSGCNNYNCIRGDPKVAQDATIGDSTFFKFGDLDWNELVTMATLIFNGDFGPTPVNPVGTLTTCDRSVNTNWGEPGNPPPLFTVAGCQHYFPIVYANGNLQLTSGRGQGILLVEGNLKVTGGFEFYGPVIVRGVLETAGTGGHFNGGVMAANVLLDQSSVLGDAVISYSSCAIENALKFNAPGRLLGQRSWAEIAQ